MKATRPLPIQSPSVTRYLVVDDHRAFRSMLAEIVPAERPEITEAHDGAEALELYGKVKPDWVLMDIEMPVMDGLTAARELVRQSPDVRIVILTQHDSPEIKRAALDAGAVAFLSKADLCQLPSLLESLTA